MPRKPSTTREQIIEGAFRLVRREGISALTARNLAGELGCSTQPVMYQFPNLSELKDLVYEKADAFHTEYITENKDFLEIGLRYIRFACEETNLFVFLFQSGRFDGMNLGTLAHQSADNTIVRAASRDLEMNEPEALDAFEILFAMVHGYACLAAGNALEYDEQTLRKNLTAAAEGLMKNSTAV